MSALLLISCLWICRICHHAEVVTALQGHTWTASASILGGSSLYTDLTGFTSLPFDISTGRAMFPDLGFTGYGIFYIQFRVVSSPEDFNLTFNQRAIVKDTTHVLMNMETEYEMRVWYNNIAKTQTTQRYVVTYLYCLEDRADDKLSWYCLIYTILKQFSLIQPQICKMIYCN